MPYRLPSAQFLPATSRLFVPIFILLGVLLNGCTVRSFPWVREECTIHADIDHNLFDYIKARYDETLPKRIAVMPFDVPENFSPPGNLFGSTGNNTSQELARRLHAALMAKGDFGIVEVFDRESWQKKGDEFFRGNYSAIEQSRSAGYDFVIVGRLEPITNDTTLRFQTKVIDTALNTTVWSGMTEVYHSARDWDRGVLRRESFRTRPDLFHFTERFESYARCTAQHLSGKPVLEDTSAN